MINIATLEVPTILKTLKYEDILKSNQDILKNILKKKGIDYQALESDEYSILLQSFSYREMYLRNGINEIVKQLILAYCTGVDLDHKVSGNGVFRLEGSKPYAPYEFELSSILDVDYVIQKGLVLTDDTNENEAILLSDITIKAGDKKVIGSIELQKEIDESAAKTEIITNSLPYVVTAKSLEVFSNGATVEPDENLLNRYLESFADKSTAGAEETYKSLVFKADKRIDDVKIIGNKSAGVEVYYYSSSADDLMHTRIETILSDKTQRPLTDDVDVIKVDEVQYQVTAVLKINQNQESAAIQIAATLNLEKELVKLQKIGEMITLSEINDFLKVPGVKEVVINQPTSNVIPQTNQIGICNAISITTANI